MTRHMNTETERLGLSSLGFLMEKLQSLGSPGRWGYCIWPNKEVGLFHTDKQAGGLTIWTEQGGRFISPLSEQSLQGSSLQAITTGLGGGEE